MIVQGEPEEDKSIEILIDLDDRDGKLASATHLFMRLVSPADTVGYITLSDLAMNQSNWNISNVFTTIVTSNPDTLPPELDLINISITGVPTNPQQPNGETYVTLNYRVRDDNSGLGWVSLRLRDPQGNMHHYWHYHQEFYRDEFDGDPTVWAEYTFTTILPEGSAPGLWGLADMTLQDKALNRKDYVFTEIVEFTI